MRDKIDPFRILTDHADIAESGIRCALLSLDETMPDYVSTAPSLRLCLALEGSVEVLAVDGRQSYCITSGDMTILPSGVTWCGGWRGSMTCIALEIPATAIQKEAGTAMPHHHGDAVLISGDIHMQRLLSALHEAFPAPTIVASLVTRQVTRAVMQHYLQRYCGISFNTPKDSRALTRRQMVCVGEFLEARLSEKITLDELAQAVGLSAAAFCRQFRRAVGIPPYQYVLRARVEKAQRQLRDTALSVGDIALSSGFYDQSQFTNTFRRIVGTSPCSYRKKLLRAHPQSAATPPA